MLCLYFKSEEARIATFTEAWPHHVDNLNPERKINAGFFLQGQRRQSNLFLFRVVSLPVGVELMCQR